MSLKNFILATAFLIAAGKAAAATENVEVTVKFAATDRNPRTVYTIKADDIEGQATTTPVKTEKEAQTLISVEIVGVRSTFASANAPYGGQITSTIKCYTQKYVKEKTIPLNSEKAQVIMAVASDRKISGICSADEVKFASALLAAYDKDKNRVLVVKLFKPVTNGKEAKQIDAAQQNLLETFNKVITHL